MSNLGVRTAVFSVAVLVLVLVVFLTASSTYQETGTDYYVVYIDDDLLGYTKSIVEIEDSIQNYIMTETSRADFQMSIDQDLEFLQKRCSEPPRFQSPRTLAREILDAISLTAHAVGIEVGGEVVATLSDKRAAEEAVDAAKKQYVQSLEADGSTEVLSVDVMQDIKFVERPAEPDDVIQQEKATEILLRGTDRTKVHEVEQGETAWAIAQTADVSVSELEKANPAENLSSLQPGDEIEMVVPDPHISFESVETSSYIEHIPYSAETREDPDRWPWERVVTQQGQPGEIEVKVEIKREEGEEVSREVISREKLSDPVTHKVVQGTKAVPQKGSGQFILPASGDLTSGFGWRSGGFHYGIDLAMPIGTSVKAADAGTVVFAGRSGAYGIKIRIDHGEGEYVTVYAHLSRTTVSVGDVVEQGQVIGYSGNTGRSTGPHLHFEIHVDGEPKDPLQFFSD